MSLRTLPSQSPSPDHHARRDAANDFIADLKKAAIWAIAAFDSRLFDFFHLDPNLLAVAAQNSPRTATGSVDRKQLSSWIESLSVEEKDEILIRLMAGEETNIGMELEARFHRRRSTTGSTVTLKARTVSELLAAAETHRTERRQEEQRKAALERSGEHARRQLIAKSFWILSKGKPKESGPMWKRSWRPTNPRAMIRRCNI